MDTPKHFEKHLIEDGEFWFMPNFLSKDQAIHQESLLINTIEWKQEEVYVLVKNTKSLEKQLGMVMKRAFTLMLVKRTIHYPGPMGY